MRVGKSLRISRFSLLSGKRHSCRFILTSQVLLLRTTAGFALPMANGISFNRVIGMGLDTGNNGNTFPFPSESI